MVECEPMHRAYDNLANGRLQVGELPPHMRVQGKVAWMVFGGPYSELGERGWPDFWQKVGQAKLRMTGAPGDVYVCPPEAHKEDRQARMLTILWAPVE